jgi:sugar phosphate permease
LIQQGGWRSACWTMGTVLIAVLVPLNLLLHKRPEDLGLMPDGAISQDAASGKYTNIVDPVWAAVDWTLSRALRTARFWWIARAFFCALFAWYAVQVPPAAFFKPVDNR